MKFGNRFVLFNCRLFDSERGRLLDNRSVLVEDGKIKAVEKGNTAEEARASTPVDLGGLTLLPGLIDTHVHITVPFMHQVTPRAFFAMGRQIERNARACIEAGITTVRDVGGFPGRLSSLIPAIVSGDIPGPRIIRCNSCIAAPGGCPDWVPSFRHFVKTFLGGQYAERVGSPEEAARQTDEMIRQGAQWIKVYCQNRSWLLGGGALPVLDRATFRAVMDTARRYGKKVCCHISGLEDLKYAMSMGADTFEHSPLEKIPDEIAVEFAARGMVLNPTLACLDVGSDELWQTVEVLLDERGPAFLEPEPLRQVRRHIRTYRTDPYPPPRSTYLKKPCFDVPLITRGFPHALANVGRVLHAGGRVGVGTDSGGLPIALFGLFYAEELKRLQSAGLTPAQVLMLATSGNASILGMGDKLGAIGPGRVADMIAVEGNPLEDLGAVSKVRMVMKAGRFLKGAPGAGDFRIVSKWLRGRNSR
jgi:imidazolonepropionase-like amidohydrolase